MRLSKRVALIYLTNDKGELLMYHREKKPGLPEADKWSFFGGGVKWFESGLQGLKRELREELNIDVFDIRSDCIYENEKGQKIYFYTGIVTAPLKDIKITEGDAVSYFSKDDVLSMLKKKIIETTVSKYLRLRTEEVF